ncbi:hypothetical protein Bca4012_044310 [Brassica carinata]|uniref:Uncharacterized protein n=1 Tax=Brassica carinata TaxID=52824 RepID=A0A8X7QS12_BRACI|nr:hypothetical protein Bca52824_058185 [Brassica carinata]
MLSSLPTPHSHSSFSGGGVNSSSTISRKKMNSCYHTHSSFIKLIGGEVTAAKGFNAAGICAGLRASGKKSDLALVTCDVNVVAAGSMLGYELQGCCCDFSLLQEPGRYNDGRGQHIADSVFEASMMEDPVMVAAGVSKQRRQRWSSRARGGETECWF